MQEEPNYKTFSASKTKNYSHKQKQKWNYIHSLENSSLKKNLRLIPTLSVSIFLIFPSP